MNGAFFQNGDIRAPMMDNLTKVHHGMNDPVRMHHGMNRAFFPNGSLRVEAMDPSTRMLP